MSKHKTFFGKIFGEIGEFFQGLFDAAQRAWDKLEPTVQQALIHGSGVVDIINRNLDAAPTELIDLIQKTFPDLSIDQLKAGLLQVDAAFSVAIDIEDPDLETLLKNLQEYLKGLKGNFWEAVSSTVAQVLAIAFAPEKTAFSIVATLIEFVYRTFIKK